jgi:hypothetical protein
MIKTAYYLILALIVDTTRRARLFFFSLSLSARVSAQPSPKPTLFPRGEALHPPNS